MTNFWHYHSCVHVNYIQLNSIQNIGHNFNADTAFNAADS